MRIQRALRISRSARCVADGRGGSFVELGPREFLALRRDQCLVAIDVRNRFEHRHVFFIRHAYPRPDVGAILGDARDQRRKTRIEKKHLVLSVIHDVNQLIKVQAWIAGMNDQTAARDGIVDLDVAVVVPSQGCHCRSGRQAQIGERVGQLADSQRAA